MVNVTSCTLSFSAFCILLVFSPPSNSNETPNLMSKVFYIRLYTGTNPDACPRTPRQHPLKRFHPQPRPRVSHVRWPPISMLLQRSPCLLLIPTARRNLPNIIFRYCHCTGDLGTWHSPVNNVASHCGTILL